MYKTIVRRRTAAVFEALNRRDSSVLLSGLGEGPQHVMYGTHALGGARNQKETVAAWYERLLRLLPDLTFHVDAITVAGWPWATRVVVEWRDEALGGAYRNQGVNVIELAWGKVRAIRIHCDTEAMAAALAGLAAQGTDEAQAPALVDVGAR